MFLDKFVRFAAKRLSIDPSTVEVRIFRNAEHAQFILDKIHPELDPFFELRESLFNHKGYYTDGLHFGPDDNPGLSKHLVMLRVGPAARVLKVLMHEMVHVAQTSHGRLSYEGNQPVWEGQIYHETDYHKLPWEIEANRIGRKLFCHPLNLLRLIFT